MRQETKRAGSDGIHHYFQLSRYFLSGSGKAIWFSNPKANYGDEAGNSQKHSYQMILDQSLGIFLIVLVLMMVISFFSQVRCVTDFYAKGFAIISKSLHLDKKKLRVSYRCGEKIQMEIKLENNIAK